MTSSLSFPSVSAVLVWTSSLIILSAASLASVRISDINTTPPARKNQTSSDSSTFSFRPHSQLGPPLFRYPVQTGQNIMNQTSWTGRISKVPIRTKEVEQLASRYLKKRRSDSIEMASIKGQSANYSEFDSVDKRNFEQHGQHYSEIEPRMSSKGNAANSEDLKVKNIHGESSADISSSSYNSGIDHFYSKFNGFDDNIPANSETSGYNRTSISGTDISANNNDNVFIHHVSVDDDYSISGYNDNSVSGYNDNSVSGNKDNRVSVYSTNFQSDFNVSENEEKLIGISGCATDKVKRSTEEEEISIDSGDVTVKKVKKSTGEEEDESIVTLQKVKRSIGDGDENSVDSEDTTVQKVKRNTGEEDENSVDSDDVTVQNITANVSADDSHGQHLHLTPEQQEILRRQEQCYELHQNDTVSNTGSECPWVFDGWSCIEATPAGETAIVPCPGFIQGFDPLLFGEKQCWSNGTWFQHPLNGKLWTNYTKCVNVQSMEFHLLVNRIYIVGYSVSLVTLTISLAIFFIFKSLKCTRVRIHKNLFVSFMANNLLWLIWSAGFALDTEVLMENPTWCQVLHVVLHYFLVSTYFWMLCEGLYLHTILVVTFVAEGKLLKCFLLLGWFLPVPFIVLYSIFRANDPHCWMEENDYNYILSGPVIISMFLNGVFLINIVRVLVTKLRAANASPDQRTTRKAVRATLILVPLLGLHFLLTPFRPPEESPMLKPYLVVSAIASSFQGFAVALLFCFFNGEVLAVLRKKWRQRRLMTAPQSYGAATFSYKASMADGLTQVTTFNAAGEPEDV